MALDRFHRIWADSGYNDYVLFDSYDLDEVGEERDAAVAGRDPAGRRHRRGVGAHGPRVDAGLEHWS